VLLQPSPLFLQVTLNLGLSSLEEGQELVLHRL
jgi:hypothetical protein